MQQDHKEPRQRVTNDNIDNWQPLCDQCNVQKSVACRECLLDCKTCPWANPEKFTPLRITSENILKFRVYAKDKNINPDKLINQILESL